MAYISPQNKAAKEPAIKALCKQYGLKASLSVSRSKSTLRLNISQGAIDFIQNYNDLVRDSGRAVYSPITDEYMTINPYWYSEHFTGTALEFLTTVLAVMYDGNHDNSDLMTDYFDVGWYVEINIGSWDKPYKCVGQQCLNLSGASYEE